MWSVRNSPWHVALRLWRGAPWQALPARAAYRRAASVL
jgi:hypothetical protein